MIAAAGGREAAQVAMTTGSGADPSAGGVRVARGRLAAHRLRRRAEHRLARLQLADHRLVAGDRDLLAVVAEGDLAAVVRVQRVLDLAMADLDVQPDATPPDGEAQLAD